MTVKERIQRQEKILDRQLEWVRAADAKVPPMVVLNAAMLASIAATAPSIDSMEIPVMILAGCFLASSLSSFIFLVKSLTPEEDNKIKSVVYFCGIVELDCMYDSTMKELTDEAYLLDLIRQSSINARIARTKFVDIKIATFFVVMAIGFWLTTLYVFLGGTKPFY